MNNSQNKKKLQIVLLVLIAILTLGIGYAGITAVNLIINGNATASVNQENFKVYFVSTADTPSLTGNVTLTGSATIDSEDNTIAHFNVSGLTKAGDYAIATYTIINDSEAIGAEISLQLTNSNSEYFKVTETISDSQLQAGDTTTGTIKVEMIKTPLTEDVSTSVIGSLTATPMENVQASGGEQKSVIGTRPYIYTINNNRYNNRIIKNQPLPDGIDLYYDFNSASGEFEHLACIANIVENGIVLESYAAFTRNGEVYYIRGCGGDEFGQSKQPVYNANVKVLKEAFGGEDEWLNYCTEEVTTVYQFTKCIADDLTVFANADGDIYVGTDTWRCRVHDNDYGAYCINY